MKKKIYVIQEHWASHHHFDLRLQRGKVLKSWAVPKQPPRRKGLRRLAVEVEDHALSYAKFEGEIKEGYGKGKVEVWDQGWYEEKSWEKNKIVVEIHGDKLEGEYVLVKMKDKNWLFFKR